MKKRIKIRCLLCNCIAYYPYHILIYNHKQHLIYDGFTTKYGVLDFDFPEYGLYKIVIKSNNSWIPKVNKKSIFLSPNCSDLLIFTLHSYCNSKSKDPITIRLTDRNYKGLPIEKGEIKLWNI